MKIKIIILSALMSLSTLFFVGVTFIKKPVNASTTFFENQKRLGRMARMDGVYRAYTYFKENFKNYDPSTNHYLGHFLGEEAYRQLGQRGFDVCNYGLDYGCTHGFVIAGINEKGEAFFGTVMEECKKIDPTDVKRGSCIHGVSHTILSLKGYANSDLNWALKKCDEILVGGESDDPATCYSAVFMENNLMSLDGRKNGEWFITRKFNQDKPTYPCESLDTKYKWACYSELGSFWSNNFGQDFGRMSYYCNIAPVGDGRNGCFWGVGRTMADLYKYNIEKIGLGCQKITKTDTLSFCIQGASIVMLNNGANRASDICNYEIPKNKTSCRNFFLENTSL